MPRIPPTPVFTLASGRSGTHFLAELIRHNAADCVARHETYGYNPSMFGRPIYDRAAGDRASTRRLLARKQRIVASYQATHYVETSHAFLKSWSDLAPEFFPGLKLIHLIRDPLKVAKSEASRESLIKRLRIPLCHYRGGDGQRYFLWSLTGLEPFFQAFDQAALSRFQWYALQWIAIENRALALLRTSGKETCFTLRSPTDLTDADRISALFDFLHLTRRHSQLRLIGRKNRNWRPTVITDDDRRQFAAVVECLPNSALEIFRHEPYSSHLDSRVLALLT